MWNRVSEVEPPRHKWVLVCTGKLVDVRELSTCDADVDPAGMLWYGVSDHLEPLPFAAVTHWMHFPAPPTAGDSGGAQSNVQQAKVAMPPARCEKCVAWTVCRSKSPEGSPSIYGTNDCLEVQRLARATVG